MEALTSFLRAIVTCGFTGFTFRFDILFIETFCFNSIFALYAQIINIVARERELKKDLVLVEVESIELPSKAATFSSASRLAFSRRSLANASASSASARRRALRVLA